MAQPRCQTLIGEIKIPYLLHLTIQATLVAVSYLAVIGRNFSGTSSGRQK